MAEKTMKEIRDEVAMGVVSDWSWSLMNEVPKRRSLDKEEVEDICRLSFQIAEAFCAARYDADNKPKG